jgi:hypothetical protein
LVTVELVVRMVPLGEVATVRDFVVELELAAMDADATGFVK